MTDAKQAVDLSYCGFNSRALTASIAIQHFSSTDAEYSRNIEKGSRINFKRT